MYFASWKAKLQGPVVLFCWFEATKTTKNQPSGFVFSRPGGAKFKIPLSGFLLLGSGRSKTTNAAHGTCIFGVGLEHNYNPAFEICIFGVMEREARWGRDCERG